MADAAKQSALETARARLETALSALTHGVANSRTALDESAAAAQEHTVLAKRVESLEMENLKLHEQVAAYALQPEPVPDDTKLAEAAEEITELRRIVSQMEQEKTAIKADLDKAIFDLETMLEDA